MDIAGIKASIVLSWYNNIVYVSARSIDEVNVQVMMEKTGRRRSQNYCRCPAERCDDRRGPGKD